MIKPVWKSFKINNGLNLRFPQEIKLKDNMLASFDEELQVITLSKNGESIATDVLSREKDMFECVEMEVNPETRKCGLGGLLHAFTVMLAKENKLKKLQLFSLPEAVRFHFNKGFRTACGGRDTAVSCMRSIIKSDTPYDDLKVKAKDIMFNLSLSDKKAIEMADHLYDEYLNRAIKDNVPREKLMLPSTLVMDLSMKRVGKNAEFYNTILNDFGIDYVI